MTCHKVKLEYLHIPSLWTPSDLFLITSLKINSPPCLYVLYFCLIKEGFTLKEQSFCRSGHLLCWLFGCISVRSSKGQVIYKLQSLCCELGMKAIKWIKNQTDQGDSDTDQPCPWQNPMGQDVFTGLPMIYETRDSEFTTALKLVLHNSKSQDFV